MSKALICVIVLLPSASSLAAGPAPATPPFREAQDHEILVEDLAYSFLINMSQPAQRMRGVISDEGVERLEPAIAERKREIDIPQALAVKLSRLCEQLRTAGNGAEFASVFVATEVEERNETRQVATRLLSVLELHDREALKVFLNTRIRPGYGRSSADYAAWFAAEPFPSAKSDAIIRRTCEASTQLESRVEP